MRSADDDRLGRVSPRRASEPLSPARGHLGTARGPWPPCAPGSQGVIELGEHRKFGYDPASRSSPDAPVGVVRNPAARSSSSACSARPAASPTSWSRRVPHSSALLALVTHPFGPRLGFFGLRRGISGRYDRRLRSPALRPLNCATRLLQQVRASWRALRPSRVSRRASRWAGLASSSAAKRFCAEQNRLTKLLTGLYHREGPLRRRRRHGRLRDAARSCLLRRPDADRQPWYQTSRCGQDEPSEVSGNARSPIVNTN